MTRCDRAYARSTGWQEAPSLWAATQEQRQDRSPGLLPENNRRRPQRTLHVERSRLLMLQVARYVGRRQQETGGADHQTVGSGFEPQAAHDLWPTLLGGCATFAGSVVIILRGRPPQNPRCGQPDPASFRWSWARPLTDGGSSLWFACWCASPTLGVFGACAPSLCPCLL